MRLESFSSLSIVLPVLVGCSQSPSRIDFPPIDAGVGTAAVQQYDGNGDGMLSSSELENAPALRYALARIDSDKNGNITAEEIDARIEQWRKSKVGLASCAIVIHQNGRPVNDAKVTMVPEKFLSESIEPASGVTDDRGMARMKISNDPDKDGVRVGFYRVYVSKMLDGKETIPSRYSTGNELGFEVAADVFDSRNPLFELQSR